MLTREQKIDFLKCCIAAYEDERLMLYTDQIEQTPGKIKMFITGFCLIMDAWQAFRRTERVMYLKDSFPEFMEYADKKRTKSGSGYYFNNATERAIVARQFLKQEYGITVPKRKQLKAKKK